MTSNFDKNYVTVYSTETGTHCPKCGKPVKHCACGKKKQAAKNDGIVRVRLDKKGRKGKGMTVISGIPRTMDELLDLSKQFKQLCGSGGTVKEGEIEIQGDHRDKLIGELGKMGFTVKRAGG